jgi:drug/metabolite transporter (DMT)-like permease
MRFKKLVGVILIVAYFILVIAYLVRDFIVNDGVDYFSRQPHQLLFVAVIGIASGFILFFFSALSPRLQRRVKLVVLGSGASFVMMAGGYITFQVASLSARFDPAITRHIPWILLLGTITIAGLLWFEFYQVLKSRNRAA